MKRTILYIFFYCHNSEILLFHIHPEVSVLKPKHNCKVLLLVLFLFQLFYLRIHHSRSRFFSFFSHIGQPWLFFL